MGTISGVQGFLHGSKDGAVGLAFHKGELQ